MSRLNFRVFEDSHRGNNRTRLRAGRVRSGGGRVGADPFLGPSHRSAANPTSALGARAGAPRAWPDTDPRQPVTALANASVIGSPTPRAILGPVATIGRPGTDLRASVLGARGAAHGQRRRAHGLVPKADSRRVGAYSRRARRARSPLRDARMHGARVGGCLRALRARPARRGCTGFARGRGDSGSRRCRARRRFSQAPSAR